MLGPPHGAEGRWRINLRRAKMTRRPEKELDYYAEMLMGIRNKKYESYVISRIIHLLNDRELELTTQQLVRTKNGRFLLDLYFPQLKLAIEVDEPHHDAQVNHDKTREKAVVEVGDVHFERVRIKDQSNSAVNFRIDEVIGVIRQKKKELKTASLFVPFVYGQKYKTEFWLKKGRLSASDDARFQTHVDVAMLFGKNYEGHQKAIIKLDDGHSVWFPKLYENGDWDNKLTPDGKTIEMRKVSGGKFNSKEIKEVKSYVFAHHRDEFGKIYYAFKGLFKVKSQRENEAIFSRVSDAIEFDGKGRVKPA